MAESQGRGRLNANGLSPIVPILPTGYRNIQPLHKGKGWRSTSVTPSKQPSSSTSKSDHALPLLPRTEAPKKHPDRIETEQEEESDKEPLLLPLSIPKPTETIAQFDLEHIETHQVLSPKPPRPSPSRKPEANTTTTTQGNQSLGSSHGRRFHPPPSPSPSSPVSPSPRTEDISSAMEPLDQETSDRLWLEYQQRTSKNTRVDPQVYHRKMQAKYSETKHLKERIVHLEHELTAATKQNKALAKGVVSMDEHHQPTTSIENTLGSEHGNHSIGTRNVEIYQRERLLKVERRLTSANETIQRLESQCNTSQTQYQASFNTLTAKLKLETQANTLLSQRIAESDAALKAAVQQVVHLQQTLVLEKEQKRVTVEELQEQSAKEISDQRFKVVKTQVQSAVRTLGKEGLYHKVEKLQQRVAAAEQATRHANMKVEALKQEKLLQEKYVEKILSSSALKYHVQGEPTSLNEDTGGGGIPRILEQGTTLFQGTRVLDDRFLMLHFLYEAAAPLTDDITFHFIVYEPVSAQDDYVSFYLADIQRLIPDSARYLAPYSKRKTERYLEVAELLFNSLRIGYKSGHLMLTERPYTPPALAASSSANNNEDERSQWKSLPIYRGSQYLEPAGVLLEIVVTEVWDPVMSDVWWLEVEALNPQSEEEYRLRIDLMEIVRLCPQFGSYRPSDGFEKKAMDFAMHEELLQPLLMKLRLSKKTKKQQSDSQANNKVPETEKEDLTIDSHQEEEEEPERRNEEEEEEEVQLGRYCNATPNWFSKKPTDQVLLTSRGTKNEQEKRGEGLLNQQEEVALAVLDHRCIVVLEETYYCMRIQEIWDGELMLLVSLEDPETPQQRHQVVLHEPQVIQLAQFAAFTGLCDGKHTNQVHLGIPQAVRPTFIKLLKKHATVFTTQEDNRKWNPIVLLATQSTLTWKPIRHRFSLPCPALHEVSSSSSWWWEVDSLVPENNSGCVEKLVSLVLSSSQLKCDRLRFGCKSRRGKWLLVQYYSQIAKFEGFVVAIATAMKEKKEEKNIQEAKTRENDEDGQWQRWILVAQSTLPAHIMIQHWDL